MKPFWIRFREAETGVILHAHAEFEDNEVLTLLSFAEYAHLLGSTGFFKEGGNLNLNITWNKKDGLSSACEMPHDDLVSAFLHRLRPFVLQEEATHFPLICNILSRRLKDPTIQNKIKERKKIYFGERLRNMVVISSDDVIINAEGTLNKWQNAFEYHRDSAKKKEIENLQWLLPKDSSRALFLQMLCEKSVAIFYVQWLINALRPGLECGDNLCSLR